MSDHISTVLDKALARLAAGEPLEAILADHPLQRDELIPLLAVARELSSLQTVPPPTNAEAGLAAFMDEARVLRAEPAPQRCYRRWLDDWLMLLNRLLQSPQTRPVLGAVTALVVLLVSTGGTMALAADSLPGDWLYPVKLAGEEVRLSLISDQSDRAQYHLVRAQTRAKEVQRLAEDDGSLDEVTLVRLNQSLEASLLAVASADRSDIPRLLVAIEEMAIEQAALLNTIEATVASAHTRQLLGLARSSLVRTGSFARAGQADVYAFCLNARLGALQIGRPSSLSPEVDLPAATAVPTATGHLPAEPLVSVTPTGDSVVESSAGETQTSEPTATATIRPTGTPAPTAVFEPSPTPAPSHTPRPSNTPEPQPPTNTLEPLPTNTPEPSSLTNTPEPSSPTNTPEPPSPTNTPEPPSPTNTPEPPSPTNTPEPPPTNTPEPPPPTSTHQPPGLTKTPQPPGKIKTPKP